MNNYEVVSMVRNRARVFTFISLFSLALLVLFASYLLPNYIDVIKEGVTDCNKSTFNIFGALSWFCGFYTLLFILISIRFIKKMKKWINLDNIDFKSKNETQKLLNACYIFYGSFLYLTIWLTLNNELEKMKIIQI